MNISKYQDIHMTQFWRASPNFPQILIKYTLSHKTVILILHGQQFDPDSALSLPMIINHLCPEGEVVFILLIGTMYDPFLEIPL